MTGFETLSRDLTAEEQRANTKAVNYDMARMPDLEGATAEGLRCIARCLALEIGRLRDELNRRDAPAVDAEMADILARAEKRISHRTWRLVAYVVRKWAVEREQLEQHRRAVKWVYDFVGDSSGLPLAVNVRGHLERLVREAGQ